MTYDSPATKRTLSGIVGVAAILFYLWLLTWAAPAKAMSGVIAGPDGPESLTQQTQIFKRGRTPLYPYFTTGPGPRGWSGYFGFVPYSKGEIENQAIQRQFYPQNSWPHDPNAPVPHPWGLGN